MKRFLIASDLSARSDRALERTVHLANRFHGELRAAHVMDPLRDAERLEPRRAEAAHLLREQIEAVTRGGAGRAADVEVEIVSGRPFTEIDRIAREYGADLVLTGTGREDRLVRWFLGSTIERLLQLGNHPLLIVKRRTVEAYWRVLVAMDFSEAARRSLATAARLVPGGGEFHLLHAVDAAPRARGSARANEALGRALVEWGEQRMDELLASDPVGASTAIPQVRYGEPMAVLGEAMERLKPDLVVVGTHGRTVLGRMLLGSVAQSVIAAAPCDVLAAGLPSALS